MDISKIIIAIDGYSSTGKSTFAKLIAQHLKLKYIDSGAIYRAVSLYALDNHFVSDDNQIDVKNLELALQKLEVHFKNIDGETFTYIGELCVEEEIRTLRVSNIVSPIAELSCVRKYVDTSLRHFANDGGIVMDGRDIGTTVFPQAQLKVFMRASDYIRAKRRYEEMLARGNKTNMEEVLSNLKNRDYIDSHREISPLRQADDAIVLDNSYLTLQQQLQWLEWVLENKLFHEFKSRNR